MHTVYLGIGTDLFASSLVAMRENGLIGDHIGPLPDGTTEAQQLQGMYKTWCKEHRLPPLSGSFNPFTYHNLGRKSQATYPVTSHRLKAAAAKQLLIFLQHLTVRVAGREDCEEWYPVVQAASASMAHLIVKLDRAPDWLSLEQAEEISDHGLSFLRQYSYLVQRSLRKREMMYKVRPKLHFFHHLMFEIRARRYNVCKTQTFAGEDFMGKMKSLGRKCHRTSISKRALQRYVQLVGCRWKNVHCTMRESAYMLL